MLPTPIYHLSISPAASDGHAANLEVPPIKSYPSPRTVCQIKSQLFGSFLI